MATKTKAGADGLALPPVRSATTFDTGARNRADLARIADDLHALNAKHAATDAAARREWERGWLERARELAGCNAETKAIDPAIPVGMMGNTPRFWCFHREGRRYRLSIREGKTYTNSTETFPTYAAAEAEVARRNAKAVRR